MGFNEIAKQFFPQSIEALSKICGGYAPKEFIESKQEEVINYASWSLPCAIEMLSIESGGYTPTLLVKTQQEKLYQMLKKYCDVFPKNYFLN